MFDLRAWITGGEGLILLWIAVMLVWAVWTIRLARRFDVSRARKLVRGEAGLSYTLAFVLTMPIYTLTCLMIGEVTILLVTKVGTVYAAHAGARSAAVWESMDPKLRGDRVRQAVVNGVAPFAMSGETDVSATPSPQTTRHADEYVASLKSYSGAAINEPRVKTHYEKVANRAQHQILYGKNRRETPPSNFRHGDDITCKVTYRAPFITPGVGRLLDEDHKYPFEVEMTSEVTLTVERPKNNAGTLGIDYRSY